MFNLENVKPLLTGAIGGAVVLAIVGFTWGGWVTAGTAESMATKRAKSATVAVLAPICVAKFQEESGYDEIHKVAHRPSGQSDRLKGHIGNLQQ